MFSCGPSVGPEKMKFAEIRRNPKNAGRKAHKVHQCVYCNIVLVDAGALAEHGRRKKHLE